MRSRTREAVIYDEHSCSRKFNLLRPAGADAEEASPKKNKKARRRKKIIMCGAHFTRSSMIVKFATLERAEY